MLSFFAERTIFPTIRIGVFSKQKSRKQCREKSEHRQAHEGKLQTDIWKGEINVGYDMIFIARSTINGQKAFDVGKIH